MAQLRTCPQCEAETSVASSSAEACEQCGHVFGDSDAPLDIDLTAFQTIDATQAQMTIAQVLGDAGEDGAGVDLSGEDEPGNAAALMQRGDGGEDDPRRYEMGDMVAQGGMGMIMSARDVNIRREIALKVIKPGAGTGKKDLVRFIEEAQVTGQLEHPNIIPVYELGVDDQNRVFYTMKMIHGRTFKEVLKKLADGDPKTVSEWPLHRLLSVFMKTCDAIAFAHSRNVIHRDLKPENIMIGDFGEVTVLDWGLSKILKEQLAEEEPDESDFEATRADLADAVRSLRDDAEGVYTTLHGKVMGTPAFMSPEQALGDHERTGQASDIYALGAILYKLLCLRTHVVGHDVKSVLKRVIDGKLQSPLIYNDVATDDVQLLHLPHQRIPSSLAAVAMKALRTEIVDRYATVTDLQREIEQWQGGFATQAEEASAWQHAKLFFARHKTTVVSIVSVAVFFVLLIAVLTTWYFAQIKARERNALHERNLAEQARQEAVAARAEVETAQEETLAISRRASPEFVANGLRYLDEWKTALAVRAGAMATELDPENAQAWFLRGRASLMARDLNAAQDAFEAFLALTPTDASGRGRCQNYLSLIDAQLAGRGSIAQGVLELKDPIATMIFASGADARADMIRLVREDLADENPGLDPAKVHLHYAQNERLRLDVTGQAALRSLETLRGLPLGVAILSDTRVEDLAPLRGMPLKILNIAKTGITDLEPLRGMPLEQVFMHKAKVHDLSPLKGAKLKKLSLNGAPVSDLGPLEGMPLTRIDITGTKVVQLEGLRGMPLKSISMAYAPPMDLSPLRDTDITQVTLMASKISDLSGLEGTGVTWLDIRYTKVEDLSPLAGLPLRTLLMAIGTLTDLSPLRDVPLNNLQFPRTEVSDLSPLAGKDIQTLVIHGAPVSDLSPLRGMPLRRFIAHDTLVRDISVLAGIKSLEEVSLPSGVENVGVLRDLPNLKSIALGRHKGVSPAEFWETYDQERAAEAETKPQTAPGAVTP